MPFSLLMRVMQWRSTSGKLRPSTTQSCVSAGLGRSVTGRSLVIMARVEHVAQFSFRMSAATLAPIGASSLTTKLPHAPGFMTSPTRRAASLDTVGERILALPLRQRSNALSIKNRPRRAACNSGSRCGWEMISTRSRFRLP